MRGVIGPTIEDATMPIIGFITEKRRKRFLIKSLLFLVGSATLFLAPSTGQSDQGAQLKDIPLDVVKYCYDARGMIADRGAKWNPADVINGRPQSRLINACQESDDFWQLTCEMGGRGHYFRIVKVHKKQNQWLQTEAQTYSHEPRTDCSAAVKSQKHK